MEEKEEDEESCDFQDMAFLLIGVMAAAQTTERREDKGLIFSSEQ